MKISLTNGHTFLSTALSRLNFLDIIETRLVFDELKAYSSFPDSVHRPHRGPDGLQSTQVVPSMHV